MSNTTGWTVASGRGSSLCEAYNLAKGGMSCFPMVLSLREMAARQGFAETIASAVADLSKARKRKASRARGGAR